MAKHLRAWTASVIPETGWQAVNVGYLYGLHSVPPRDGGSIHVSNVVRHWRELGCLIHTLGPEDNPECVVHPPDAHGLQTFLNAIDVLCMRVDGRMLMDNPMSLACMRKFAPRPIVWEINAPAEELLARLFVAGPAEGLSGVRRLVRKHLWSRRVKRENALRRRCGRMVHVAVCVSTALQRYASVELGIKRCEVIPNGSDPDLFSPDRQADNPLSGLDGFFKVVYSGDFRWSWQGFELIRGLAARARQDHRKIVFIVLNNSPSSAIAGSDNIVVFDRVPYSKVPAYLAAGDACLCLYRSFSWSRYGFYLSPLKLYDYMAAGKPIIASRLGQIAEVIEDGQQGLLAEDDLDDIYAKITFCQDHPDLARQWGEAARAKVISHYNWHRVATAMLGVFRSVVHTHRPA